MKKIVTLLAVLLFYVTSFSQTQPVFVTNPFPKTISVTGSAEMEIVPDEIYVNITLQEYQKKGSAKKELEPIKNQFLESCRAVGIPDSLISIVSYSGYTSYYLIKKKKTGMNANIVYQVKFKNSKMMDDLVEKMDDDATTNFQIVRVSHSRIIEYRKQLKVKAVQSARDKGIYLTEAVGEKLGEAITINEPVEDNLNMYINPGYMAGNQMISQIREDAARSEGTDIDFKKIKLRFEVAAVYALK